MVSICSKLPKIAEPAHSTPTPGATITSTEPRIVQAVSVYSPGTSTASRRSITEEPKTETTWVLRAGTHRPVRLVSPKTATDRSVARMRAGGKGLGGP